MASCDRYFRHGHTWHLRKKIFYSTDYIRLKDCEIEYEVNDGETDSDYFSNSSLLKTTAIQDEFTPDLI